MYSNNRETNLPAIAADVTWTNGVSRLALGNEALIFFLEVE